MDSFLAITSLVQAKSSLQILKTPESFLNVDAEKLYLFHAISAAKCVICGFGTKKVPKYLTLAMLLVNLVIVFSHVNISQFRVLVFFKALAASACRHVHKVNVAPLIAFWCFAGPIRQLHLLLDVYTIVTLLAYLFSAYGKEYEKALTFLSLPFCFGWCIDSFHGNNPLSFVDITITWFFLAVMIIALKPARRNTLQIYAFMCASVWLGISYKYYNILLAQGLSIYPFAIPEGKYEQLKLISNYLYETFGFYIPSIKLSADDRSMLVSLKKSTTENVTVLSQDVTSVIIRLNKTMETRAM